MSECYIIKNGGHKVGDSHDLSLVRKSFLEMNLQRKGEERTNPSSFSKLTATAEVLCLASIWKSSSDTSYVVSDFNILAHKSQSSLDWMAFQKMMSF